MDGPRQRVQHPTTEGPTRSRRGHEVLSLLTAHGLPSLHHGLLRAPCARPAVYGSQPANASMSLAEGRTWGHTERISRGLSLWRGPSAAENPKTPRDPWGFSRSLTGVSTVRLTAWIRVYPLPFGPVKDILWHEARPGRGHLFVPVRLARSMGCSLPYAASLPVPLVVTRLRPRRCGRSRGQWASGSRQRCAGGARSGGVAALRPAGLCALTHAGGVAAASGLALVVERSCTRSPLGAAQRARQSLRCAYTGALVYSAVQGCLASGYAAAKRRCHRLPNWPAVSALASLAMSTPRCLFHKYTTSSPEFFLGAPRSSVASGAGLEPGDPRGKHWRRTYEMDI